MKKEDSPHYVLGVFDKEGAIHSRLVYAGEDFFHNAYWDETFPVHWRWSVLSCRLDPFDIRHRNPNKEEYLTILWTILDYAIQGKIEIRKNLFQFFLDLHGNELNKDVRKTDLFRRKFEELSYFRKLYFIKKWHIDSK